MRVLFCNGYSQNFLMQKGELGEQTEFILKPVTPRDLLVKVREALDRV